MNLEDIPEDYPEPADAEHVCAFCGRKTRNGPFFGPNPFRPGFNVAIPAHCVRQACVRAYEDAGALPQHPAGERPS